MLHIFKVSLCCMSVGAVMAVGVASASASFTLTTVKCEGAGVPTICWAPAAEGKELFELSGRETVTVTGSASVIKVTALNIELLGTASKGEKIEAIQEEPLTKGYLVKGKIMFEHVTVDSPKGCKLSSTTLETNALLGTPNKSSTELTFEPEAGTTGTFASVTFENNGAEECSPTVVGTNNVKGTQKCSIPNSAVDLVKHEIQCRPTGSSLKYAGDAATFESSFEKELLSKDPWSGQEA